MSKEKPTTDLTADVTESEKELTHPKRKKKNVRKSCWICNARQHA